VLAFALFFTHAFPFMIFGLGFAALFPWREPRRWLKAGLPVVPALAVLVWWVLFTEAGRLSLGAMTDTANDPKLPIDQAIGDIPNWLLNALSSRVDDAVLIALGALVFGAMALAQGDPDESHPRTRFYALLPLACAWFYFSSPQGHGYIWLISQRFPALFAIVAIPMLRMPRGVRGHVITGLAAALAVFSAVSTSVAFKRFERDDVGDFAAAMDAIPQRSKVCALIFDKGSSVTNNRFAPFLHFGSYVQSERGGIVMFTYAGYAHWPFAFKEGAAPPGGAPARLRWEWTPEKVSVRDEILPYYDHVLVRGGGFRPPPDTFERVFDGRGWQVWRNTTLGGG
jgi:hypothetical protein